MLDEKDLQAIQATINRAEERTAQKTVFMMESKFQPRFDMLSENQRSILKKVAPKSRVEELEEKVSFGESISAAGIKICRNSRRPGK